MSGLVTAVGCDAVHALSKPNRNSVRLLAGLGVEGDAHLGKTVKHRSRVAQDPSQPNLRPSAAPREVYLNAMPLDDQSTWVTELQWPVDRI